MYRNRVAGTARIGRGPCSDRRAGRAHRARWALATLLCAVASSALVPSHPFRLSVADIGVGDSVLDVRIRFFWDDLQLAVMENTSDMEFELAETREVDEVVEQYINDMLTIDADGTLLQGTVLERGIQDARNPDEVMWWYRLEYPLDPSRRPDPRSQPRPVQHVRGPAQPRAPQDPGRPGAHLLLQLGRGQRHVAAELGRPWKVSGTGLFSRPRSSRRRSRRPAAPPRPPRPARSR